MGMEFGKLKENLATSISTHALLRNVGLINNLKTLKGLNRNSML